MQEEGVGRAQKQIEKNIGVLLLKRMRFLESCTEQVWRPTSPPKNASSLAFMLNH